MTVWSRITEFVQSLGDSLSGSLEGVTGGAKPPEKSVAFTIGMIALGAKMAKADGVVTDSEERAFFQVFHVPEKDSAAVTRVFNTAKQDIAGFETYAAQVAKLFGPKSHVLETVLDGLFHIAKADKVVHPAEIAYLEEVAGIFGFTGAEWLRIRARHVAIKDDPFEVLGVEPETKLAEVKRHYKQLVKELHPDKQIAAGVPEEMVKLATDRLARINSAYAEIERMHTP
ncbi:J domain-containing protein [Aestuariivirga litoralis]|uniref:J domain-containing protein n=1 Tax=Aestuariivirga litoralis TaxID=2650924 RepID=UPI0018C7255B|nr:DnaJ family molecular chaperone [Aestuariivirga litoralis]MBG1231967.1 DnaJ family molecular chaperone [Aestuariivirga litoralis]